MKTSFTLGIAFSFVFAACSGTSNPTDSGNGESAVGDTGSDVRSVDAAHDVAPTDAPHADTIAPDGSTMDVPASDVPGTDVPAVDSPASDVPVTDVPVVDVPAADVPAMDVPVVDVPVADVPVVDVPVVDSPADVPATDAGPGACPSTPPTDGSPCGTVGLDCTYGSDPRLICRSRFTCTGGTWDEAIPDPTCTGTVAACPASEPPAGTHCPVRGEECGYGNDACDCYTCSIPCSSPLEWHCSMAAAGCPGSSPNLGDPCAPDGLECNYGACTGGWAVTCTAGAWTQTFFPCPG